SRIPARTIAALPHAPERDPAGGLVPDVALVVAEHEAPRRHPPAPEGHPRLLERLRAVEREQRREPAALGGAEPPEGDRSSPARRRRQKLVDDRTIPGEANGLPDGRTTSHADLLDDLAGGLPGAVMEEASRMRGVRALLVEIALRADVVGHAPGQA